MNLLYKEVQTPLIQPYKLWQKITYFVLWVAISTLAFFYQTSWELAWTLAGLNLIVFALFSVWLFQNLRQSLSKESWLADILLWLLIFVAIIEGIARHSELEFGKSSEDLIHLSNLGLVLSGLCFLWILMRSFESQFWKKLLNKRFKDDDLNWSQEVVSTRALFRSGRLAIFVCLCLSLVLAGIWIFDFSKPYAFSLSLAGLIPFLVPYSRWALIHLLVGAQKHRAIIDDFNSFQSLRKADLCVLHQIGVTTEEKLEFIELWIDEHQDYSREEIEDILAKLKEASDHPVTRLLNPRSGKDLTELVQIQVRPHLGLEAKFKDLNHHKVKVFWGTPVWHKILEHEISEKGMEKIRQVKSPATYLSVNQQIIAILFWTPKPRTELENDLALIRSQIPVVLASSQNLEFTKYSIDQVCLGLVPLERKIQMKHWKERAHSILEVRSWWDPSSGSEHSILFSDLRLETPLQILKGELKDLAWMIRASRAWKSYRRFHFFTAAIASLSIFVCQDILGISVLCFGFYLASLLSFKFMRKLYE